MDSFHSPRSPMPSKEGNPPSSIGRSPRMTSYQLSYLTPSQRRELIDAAKSGKLSSPKAAAPSTKYQHFKEKQRRRALCDVCVNQDIHRRHLELMEREKDADRKRMADVSTRVKEQERLEKAKVVADKKRITQATKEWYSAEEKRKQDLRAAAVEERKRERQRLEEASRQRSDDDAALKKARQELADSFERQIAADKQRKAARVASDRELTLTSPVFTGIVYDEQEQAAKAKQYKIDLERQRLESRERGRREHEEDVRRERDAAAKLAQDIETKQQRQREEYAKRRERERKYLEDAMKKHREQKEMEKQRDRELVRIKEQKDREAFLQEQRAEKVAKKKAMLDTRSALEHQIEEKAEIRQLEKALDDLQTTTMSLEHVCATENCDRCGRTVPVGKLSYLPNSE
eukprot:gnl/Carplike_NY0171/2978_a4006_592.p1 GENE.gnl/Carplike_NY0171/2978_a4006_592~~gnl/Carplike_NY0171/2978_a4006_592.p1  ORF type:complete len:403 (+),score=164.71 gnl/Carplike_NY0171/2978_a4006_592:1-1209(+)